MLGMFIHEFNGLIITIIGMHSKYYHIYCNFNVSLNYNPHIYTINILYKHYIHALILYIRI